MVTQHKYVSSAQVLDLDLWPDLGLTSEADAPFGF